MVGMGVTLNKDGTPRKIGSGKTKGAGCYAKITLKELVSLLKMTKYPLIGFGSAASWRKAKLKELHWN